MSAQQHAMVTIRKAQWDAFAADRYRRLCDWLLPHLREHFAELLEDTSDASLAPFIARNVERARGLGATSSEAVCQYVHLRLLFGPDLESLPWAAAILAQPGIGPDHKMAFLAIRADEVLAASTEDDA